MNSVLKEEKTCIDIGIYDIEKAFDGLWLDDVMNDIYDTLPPEQRDDKLSLIYESNKNNLVAVKTPVGLTERTNIKKIVTQGGTFGPIECSNSIDKIGKKCYETGENMYTYKKLVKVMPLSLCDDLLTMSTCGMGSMNMITFITSQIETKKLRFLYQIKMGNLNVTSYMWGRREIALN